MIGVNSTVNQLIVIAADMRHGDCCASHFCHACGAHVSTYNVDEVIRQYLFMCCGANDIPAARLLGREPAGQCRSESYGGDWWVACDNGTCIHAYGEGLFQVLPDWIIDTSEVKFPEIRTVSFTAIAERDEGWRKKGEALFEELKPLKMLFEQKRMMTEASWNAEYMQKPFLSGAGAIPIEKLKVVPFFDRRNVVETVMSVDKAGTEDAGCYTAIVIMSKMRDKTFVIEDVIRGQWGALRREQLIKQWADATREALMRTSVRFTVVVEQEPGSGGKESAEATVRNLAGHIVILDKPGAGSRAASGVDGAARR
jgi:hypothetical protein